MKVMVIVFVLYAQTFCINAFFGVGRKNIDFAELKNAIDRKCTTDGNKKQFTQSLRNFHTCMTRTPVKSPPTENSYRFCSFLQEKLFYMCLKNFTIDISPCLSENETYIQQLLLDAHDSVVEEFCGINGVSNFQYLFDKANENEDCWPMIGNLFFSYGSCTAKLNIFTQLEKGELNLNKHDICRDLESYHKCTTQVLEGVCNEEFSRLTNLIFHPLLLSCNDLNYKN